MKKRFYNFIILLIVAVTLTGCNSLSHGERKEQKTVISNFLQAFYSYEYTEGNTDCSGESDELCQTILDNLSPLLASETRIDSEVVNSLIVSPANFSKVSVDYISHSIKTGQVYETENGEVHGFIVVPEVKIKSNITQKEIMKNPTSFVIFLKNENGDWKVEGLDFMADNYLFYSDSLFN